MQFQFSLRTALFCTALAAVLCIAARRGLPILAFVAGMMIGTAALFVGWRNAFRTDHSSNALYVGLLAVIVLAIPLALCLLASAMQQSRPWLFFVPPM